MLIIFEGIDNAGKTTQSKIITDILKNKGYNVLLSKELTTDIGELIKRYFKIGEFSPVLKTLLFAADRQKRLEEIDKITGKYDILIMDRYVHSAIVYREAEGLEPDWVKCVNKHNPQYDIGIYIDITPEESIRRYTLRKENLIYSFNQLKLMRDLYLKYVDKGELILINGMQPAKKVTKDILKLLRDRGLKI